MSSLVRRIQKKGTKIGVHNADAPLPNSAGARGSRHGKPTKFRQAIVSKDENGTLFFTPIIGKVSVPVDAPMEEGSIVRLSQALDFIAWAREVRK